MNSDVSTLAVWIAVSLSTVFFGGAGVSVESGIPDFRGANGFYLQEREIPFETVLSTDFFKRRPQIYWKRFHEIYYPVEPNGAHRAPASLETVGRLDTAITQNIDSLHQRTGLRVVWELHGSWERLVCTSCGAVASLGDSVRVDGGPVPTCPSYVSQIRPDIVMYGRSLDQDVIEAVVTAISRASMPVVVSTSLMVYPAAGLISYFSRDHLVLMNTAPTLADAYADLIIRGSMGAILDRVMDELRVQGIIPA